MIRTLKHALENTVVINKGDERTFTVRKGHVNIVRGQE